MPGGPPGQVPYYPNAAPRGLPPGAVTVLPPGAVVIAATAAGAPAAPPVPTAQTPPPRKPLVRAQAPDTMLAPPRPAVAMPSPEQLGVGARPADGDWTVIHKRLQELGVATFQVDRLRCGRGFLHLHPAHRGAGQDAPHRAHGVTEGEAARRALDERSAGASSSKRTKPKRVGGMRFQTSLALRVGALSDPLYSLTGSYSYLVTRPGCGTG